MFRVIRVISVIILMISTLSVFAQKYPQQMHSVEKLSSPADSANPKKSDTLPESHSSKPVQQLNKMTVTVSGKQRLIETSQSFCVIKSDEWTGTSKSLADVIAEQSGVQTRRFGGTGSFQTVSIRGVMGSDVLVLLDGIPLNSAMGGAVDLSLVNTSRISEIEIYKGITPVSFGANSIGGVINLKSKDDARGTGVDVMSSLGAYGYQNYNLNAFHSPQKKIELLGSINFSGSKNDWPYLSHNRTPYNSIDDSRQRVFNHDYNELSVREYTKFNLNSDHQLKAAISYSTAKRGVPAEEGHLNPTAQYNTDMLDLAIKLDNGQTGEKSGFSVSPQVNFLYLKDYNFWTSLDKDIGNSHGISMVPNSFGEATSTNRKMGLTLLTEYYPRDFIGGDFALLAGYSDILSKTNASGFVDSDWPVSSQYMTISGQINAGKTGSGLRGLLGGSLSGVRSKTEGGHKALYKETVPQSDTIEFSYSFHGGISFHYNNIFTLFFNAARYSDLPDLREKYGTRGKTYPNPELREETGTSFETGLKYLRNSFYFEITPFLVNRYNGIIMFSDGNSTRPINLGRSLACGVEVNISGQFFPFLRAELISTVQRVENRSVIYDSTYYGELLPNEPPVSMIGKIICGPFSGLEIHYWADYKSPFYRDYKNTEGSRVPDKSIENHYISGLLFHNGMLVWKAKKHLECRFSVRNVSGVSLRYEEISRSAENGYSWILYPSNEWCFSLNYSF